VSTGSNPPRRPSSANVALPIRARFQPLPTAQFALGEGPFRVRGLAYKTVLDYIDQRFPGGRPALRDAFGAGDPWVPYLEQIFVVGADYDLSPLVRLYVVLAQLRGEAVDQFVERRSASSGHDNTSGIWKPLLNRDTPQATAERMHLAFNRYFQPCHGVSIESQTGRFEGALEGLPEPMAGMYVASTAGFFKGALGVSGAQGIEVAFDAPTPNGNLQSVPLVRVVFRVTWT
jgi:hypothetical protein